MMVDDFILFWKFGGNKFLVFVYRLKIKLMSVKFVLVFFLVLLLVVVWEKGKKWKLSLFFSWLID